MFGKKTSPGLLFLSTALKQVKITKFSLSEALTTKQQSRVSSIQTDTGLPLFCHVTFRNHGSSSVKRLGSLSERLPRIKHCFNLRITKPIFG